jgi:hypothetical protein
MPPFAFRYWPIFMASSSKYFCRITSCGFACHCSNARNKIPTKSWSLVRCLSKRCASKSDGLGGLASRATSLAQAFCCSSKSPFLSATPNSSRRLAMAPESPTAATLAGEGELATCAEEAWACASLPKTDVGAVEGRLANGDSAATCLGFDDPNSFFKKLMGFLSLFCLSDPLIASEGIDSSTAWGNHTVNKSTEQAGHLNPCLIPQDPQRSRPHLGHFPTLFIKRWVALPSNASDARGGWPHALPHCEHWPLDVPRSGVLVDCCTFRPNRLLSQFITFSSEHCMVRNLRYSFLIISASTPTLAYRGARRGHEAHRAVDDTVQVIGPLGPEFKVHNMAFLFAHSDNSIIYL